MRFPAIVGVVVLAALGFLWLRPVGDDVSSMQEARVVPTGVLLAAAALVLLIALILKTPLGITLGLRKPPNGVIVVSTTPVVQATIRLDGIYRGHSPQRLEGIPAGKRTLSIMADGYEPATRSIDLEGGDTRTENVTLIPTTPAPVAQP